MFNSHIDIINPVELLRPLKVSELLKDDYIPKSRNKILVEVLSKVGMMDKRGTGFIRIRENLKKWNLPNPEFIEKQECFVIRFNNPDVLRVPEIEESGLNERQKKAIEYLKVKNKIIRSEYVKLNKCTETTAKRDLNKLVEKNVIKRIGRTGRYTYYIFVSNGSSNGSSSHDTKNGTVKKKVKK